jgi:biopolymer transport protein ExbB/TolQ
MSPNGESHIAPALSFARQDPERRFGMPAGRYTHVNQLVSFVLAGLLTGFVYFVLLRVPTNPVSASLAHQGIVPVAIVSFSCWAMVILFVKWLKLRFQKRALSLSLLPAEPGVVLSVATVDATMDRLYELVDDPRHFVLFNRIALALGSIRNMRRLSDARDILDSQADHDEAVSDSSYSIIRGIIWAIPVLGFIGTVLGLSDSIGGFGKVLASATNIDVLKPKLQEVTAGLSLAFETTLQGLLAALVIHMAMTFLKRSEEAFLDDCKEYCQRYVLAHVRITVDSEA